MPSEIGAYLQESICSFIYFNIGKGLTFEFQFNVFYLYRTFDEMKSFVVVLNQFF